jgi:hypothetical protein
MVDNFVDCPKLRITVKKSPVRERDFAKPRLYVGDEPIYDIERTQKAMITRSCARSDCPLYQPTFHPISVKETVVEGGWNFGEGLESRYNKTEDQKIQELRRAALGRCLLANSKRH